MFVTMDRSKLEVIRYTDDEYGEDDFKVSMNEVNWEFDENNVLKSALCFIGNNRTFLPVKWDNEGAYVENKGKRIYMLVYCE
jgi:hypothetical protein